MNTMNNKEPPKRDHQESQSKEQSETKKDESWVEKLRQWLREAIA